MPIFTNPPRPIVNMPTFTNNQAPVRNIQNNPIPINPVAQQQPYNPGR